MKTAIQLYKEFMDSANHYVIGCDDVNSLFDVCLKFCKDNSKSGVMKFEVMDHEEEDQQLCVVFNFTDYASIYTIGLHSYKMDLHNVAPSDYRMLRKIWV